MASEFKLPDLGEGVKAAEVVNILVAVGDTVEVDQPVIEVETDKAGLEVPSPLAGKVTAIHVKAGESVKVGAPVLTIEAGGDATAAPAAPEGDAGAREREVKTLEAASQPGDEAAAVQAKAAAGLGVEGAAAGVTDAGGGIAAQSAASEQSESVPATEATADDEAPRAEDESGEPIFASPSTRKFAREIGVDIREVKGSGPGGRISEDDVKEHSRGAGGRPAAAPVELPDFSRQGQVTRERMNNIRRATSAHMSTSWATVPHVTLFAKADATDLERVRQRYKAQVEKAGAKLTITPILLKLVAAALQAHPDVNASIDAETNEIIRKQFVNIGVAADTARGLVVPVIRDVDHKSVVQLAVELGEAAEKARAGKLTPNEMQGGTFTLTNLGSLGVDYFTPIVNVPEVAILGVGKSKQEPVYLDGAFQPRLMLPLSLSIDHRLVDGADGARFLQWIVQAVEDPMRMVFGG